MAVGKEWSVSNEKERPERTKKQLEAIASGRLDPAKLDAQIGWKRK